MIIGVTGQRPRSLGVSFDTRSFTWKDAEEYVHKEINRYNANRLISGGALGFDMMAAKAAVDSGVALDLALPFEGYNDRWGKINHTRLEWLMDRAAWVGYICEPGYDVWKYQVRNQYIVDGCDVLCALWNGDAGGTKNCIDYAKKVSRRYNVHHPRTEEGLL